MFWNQVKPRPIDSTANENSACTKVQYRVDSILTNENAFFIVSKIKIEKI